MGAAYFIGFVLLLITLCSLAAGYVVYRMVLGLKYVGRAYKQPRI